MTIARFIVTHRRWLLAGFIGLALVSAPLARDIERRLDVAARVYGSESEAVDEQLARRFKSPFAHNVLLVVTGVPAATEPAGERVLSALLDSLRRSPQVTRTMSYLDQRDPMFAAPRGKQGTFIVVGLTSGARPDATLDSLRQVTQRIVATLRRTHPAAALRWTGVVALNADIRRASASDVQRAEARALPITLLLLVLAFGALGAAMLPVAAALFTIGITLGVSAAIANVWPLSILLQNIVTMLGLGLGIDYSLLTVSRYREERASGKSTVDAAIDSARSAGPTIVLSGAAVAIGLGALALTPVNELRTVAAGGLLIVGTSLCTATIVLPGVLAMLGGLVDAGRVPGAVRVSTDTWRRWGHFVATHPLRILALAGVPTIALAVQATRLRLDLPRGDWLPRDMESAVALRALTALDRASVVQTLRVIVELPGAARATNDAGWNATLRIASALARDSAVRSTRSLPQLVLPLSMMLPRAMVLARVPDDVIRAFASTDGRAVEIDVVPKEGLSQQEMNALAGRLRQFDAAAPAALPGTRILVGGLPAFNVDYQRAVGGRFFELVAVIVGATFIVLAIGLRSILVPLKALALNLLAVAASFGAITLVFQDGFGAALLGLQAPLEGVFPAIPVLVFCTVFGLSMDYEVFLVARVREAREAGLGENDAIAEGVARTGGVITSAAAIMIVVFAAFTLGDFVLIKVLGFGLSVAVLIDATVMRLALSPALLALAGKWNWWPGESGHAIALASRTTPSISPSKSSSRVR